MPAFIRTKKDEERWQKAKQAANKQRSESEGDVYWGLVNHIYQNMKKSELSKSGIEAVIERIDLIKDLVKTNPDVYLFNQELLNKTLETLTKAIGGEDEEDQGYDLQDYGDDEEANLDDFEQDQGEDEADKWLKEKGAEQGSESADEKTQEKSKKVEGKRTGRYVDWSPRSDYSEEHQQKIKELVDQGYSEREAEHLAGAHRGPSNFMEALHHPVKPSEPSAKRMQELKTIAKPWLEDFKRKLQERADPAKNPEKFTVGKARQIHEEATKPLEEALNDFMNQEDVKKLKGLERHKAITSFKKKWHEANPEHVTKLVEGAAQVKQHADEAQAAREEDWNQTLHHMLVGGQHAEAVSDIEGAQHVGGVEDEDKGPQASIVKDPIAAFAQANPMLIEKLKQKLNPQQLERFNMVQSARKSQGVGQKQPETKPETKPAQGPAPVKVFSEEEKKAYAQKMGLGVAKPKTPKGQGGV